MAGLTALLIGGIISTLAGLGGSIFGNLLNYNSIQKTNEQNLAIEQEKMQFEQEQAQIARDWQEDMASREIQMRADDLEAAGFNRALAVNSNGAMFPSTVSASAPRGGYATAPQVDMSGVTNMLNSFSHLMLTSAFLNGDLKVNNGKSFRIYKGSIGNSTANSNIIEYIKEPDWLKKYRKNFESTVDDL